MCVWYGFSTTLHFLNIKICFFPPSLENPESKCTVLVDMLKLYALVFLSQLFKCNIVPPRAYCQTLHNNNGYVVGLKD